MALFIRLFICISFAGFMLYKYIDKMNELTELRLSIPLLQKEVKEIHEKNLELHYTIESLESSFRLIELIRKPEFGYLKHPLINEVIFLPQHSVEDVLNSHE